MGCRTSNVQKYADIASAIEERMGAGFSAEDFAAFVLGLRSEIEPRDAEIEGLKALAQLGLKIIERGDCSCEADQSELRRFLNKASQL